MLPHALVTTRVHHDIVDNSHILIGDVNTSFPTSRAWSPPTQRYVLCTSGYISIARTTSESNLDDMTTTAHSIHGIVGH